MKKEERERRGWRLVAEDFFVFIQKMMDEYEFIFLDTQGDVVEQEQRMKLLIACSVQKIGMFSSECLFAIQEAKKIKTLKEIKIVVKEAQHDYSVSLAILACLSDVEVFIFPEFSSGKVVIPSPVLGEPPEEESFDYIDTYSFVGLSLIQQNVLRILSDRKR